MHNKSISITKGIGISLMVIGHSPCPEYLTTWIYCFHMPLFFFISGYLFKDQSLKHPKTYISKKIKSLYVPFVKWTIIFLIFHNVLAHFLIYKNVYTLSDFLDHTIRAFTLSSSEQLLGGYWFLIDLFIISIIAYFIIYLMSKLTYSQKTTIREGGVKTIYLLLITIGFLLGAYLLNDNSLFIKIHDTTLLHTAYFFAGLTYCKLNRKPSFPISIISIVLTFVISLFFMPITPKGLNLFILFPFALICITTLMVISEKLSTLRIANILDFIGTNTLIILTFHFICFKLASLIIIFRDDLPMSDLSIFPAIGGQSNFDWLLYTFFGICLPLLGVILINLIPNKYLSLISIKQKNKLLSSN